MSSINYLGIIGGIGLCLLSCVPSQSEPTQASLAKSAIRNKAIDMNEDQASLPFKQKTRPLSEAESPSRSELVLPDVYDGANTLPLITQWKEAEAYDGQLVRVVGKYIESDVRMKPIGTPRYVGHVSVVLADDIEVSLFPVWKRDARRPQAEINRFKDQEVEVIGILYRQSPVDPSGGASPLSPCLTEIKALYHFKN
ncbi:hypothetical protein NIES4074_26470 [Cylindrospermum sp. NIES-4074]|nr:hypothetical protein NIES4074_26470 [Cylindrospermum sp. NIES-4074]